MPLCGIGNLSSGSSRSIISNYVRSFVQPPVVFLENVHLPVVFHVDVCNELLNFSSHATRNCFMTVLRGLQNVVLM